MLNLLGPIANEKFKTTPYDTTISGEFPGTPSRDITGYSHESEKYFFTIKFKPNDKVMIDLEVLTCTGMWRDINDHDRTDLKKALLEQTAKSVCNIGGYLGKFCAWTVTV